MFYAHSSVYTSLHTVIFMHFFSSHTCKYINIRIHKDLMIQVQESTNMNPGDNPNPGYQVHFISINPTVALSGFRYPYHFLTSSLPAAMLCSALRHGDNRFRCAAQVNRSVCHGQSNLHQLRHKLFKKRKKPTASRATVYFRDFIYFLKSQLSGLCAGWAQNALLQNNPY